jgi:hypothetical protein
MLRAELLVVPSRSERRAAAPAVPELHLPLRERPRSIKTAAIEHHPPLLPAEAHGRTMRRPTAPGGGERGVKVERIPAELRERPQWVTWKLEELDGKQTKVSLSRRRPRARQSQRRGDLGSV